MVSSQSSRRRLKIVLVLVMVATIGVVLGVFIRYRDNSGGIQPLLSDDYSKASVSIGKVHHTATRDGQTEWRLVADSAHYMRAENRALFKNLAVVFYMEDGSEVNLTAERGYLQTETNDIQVEGNVKVNNGPYWLETDDLKYSHTSRRLHTNEPVRLSGEWFNLSADAMSMDLNTQQSEFQGNVKGILSEDILLQ